MEGKARRQEVLFLMRKLLYEHAIFLLSDNELAIFALLFADVNILSTSFRIDLFYVCWICICVNVIYAFFSALANKSLHHMKGKWEKDENFFFNSTKRANVQILDLSQPTHTLSYFYFHVLSKNSTSFSWMKFNSRHQFQDSTISYIYH